jgi:hypothetical protein
MGRLLDGDPLGLKERSVERRDELAYLIASDRAYLRSAARVAFGACVYGVEPPVDAWIAKCIDQGFAGLLRDEQSEHRAGVPVPEDEERYYYAIMDLLDVSLEQARGVCISFNALPFEPRAAYFRFSFARALRQAGGESDDADESLRRDLGRALLAVLKDGRDG